MPEGPECRVVADVIQALACNRLIEEVAVIENTDILHRYSKKKPLNWWVVTKPFMIKHVRTKGKLISLDIQTACSPSLPKEDWTLLVTLGMSGDFQYNAIKHKHCRYAFIFNDGNDLSFIDARCFGTIRIVKPAEARKLEAKLGWDVLQAKVPDELWNYLKFKIGSFEVGDALLEQKYVSGVGNIYRAETLYRTGINPKTPIMLIKSGQWNKLNTVINEVLQEAYKLNGCSVADFTANGKEGQAQQLLMVYGKDECPKNHKIETVPQSGRTMWFCPECQPLPSSVQDQ
ncbi:hypothetical protein C4588_04795 [Candidatus Parcubacteria bacterium]|nr:MAG: hypothetical protein C4588_04795 [Candidatus Parcubacteria bacterium]